MEDEKLNKWIDAANRQVWKCVEGYSYYWIIISDTELGKEDFNTLYPDFTIAADRDSPKIGAIFDLIVKQHNEIYEVMPLIV